jgi:geranylgeranyl diphosphate synthase type I
MTVIVLHSLKELLLPAIEKELRIAVDQIDKSTYSNLYSMMAYHMGWEGENAGREARGKRIRSLLVLLTCFAAGEDWSRALPAAVAVELVHNFSLIHDDIQDHSVQRRGRPAVWSKWGIPQAINTGDAMFSMAHLAILGLDKTTSTSITVEAARILQKSCLALTQGQFLDISYENRDDLTIEDYWLMIEGKTAALLGTCTELGALVANSSKENRKHYKDFGKNLGLAFQVLDDILGIWGEPTKMGKSNASDLVTGKKTLPVLYGLVACPKFAERWKLGGISPNEVPSLANQLEQAGVRKNTQEIANRLTQDALNAFAAAKPQGVAGAALKELSMKLLQRDQ